MSHEHDDPKNPRAALRGRDVREALAGELPANDAGDIRDASGRSIAPPQAPIEPSTLSEAERAARAREVLTRLLDKDQASITSDDLDRAIAEIRAL